MNLKSNRYVLRELGVGCFVLQSQSSTSHTPKSRVISCLTFSMTVLCRPSMMKSTNGLAPFRHVSSSRQKTIPQKQRDANCNLALHCRRLVERCPMRDQAPPRRKGGVGVRGKCRHYRRCFGPTCTGTRSVQ